MLIICGIVGLLSCILVIISDVVGVIVVDGYNPIQATISDLAAGDRAPIQSIGLVIFSIGIASCAIGLYRWNLDRSKWQLASVLLFLIGIDVILIAIRNEYGDGDTQGWYYTCISSSFWALLLRLCRGY